ncbi:MAG: hypothetical protein B6D45_11530, partial [Ignavibacteriales bacterium UTCHB3]
MFIGRTSERKLIKFVVYILPEWLFCLPVSFLFYSVRRNFNLTGFWCSKRLLIRGGSFCEQQKIVQQGWEFFEQQEIVQQG